MKESQEIWRKFVSLPGAVVDGNVGIASECSIRGIIEVIAHKKPNCILELGSGIGTMTYAVLKTCGHFRSSAGFPEFYTIENHPFCLSQMAINLQEFEGRYHVLNSALPLRESGMEFDFIIVDGGGDHPSDMGGMSLEGLVGEGAVVMFEGSRKAQRDQLVQLYAHRHIEYFKLFPVGLELCSEDGTITARNKACHLYIFEPELMPLSWIRYRSLYSHVVNSISQHLHHS